MQLLEWPTLSRFGLQANWIIGGGPHIRMRVSSLGGGRRSLTMSSLMKPRLYSQSETQRNYPIRFLSRMFFNEDPLPA